MTEPGFEPLFDGVSLTGWSAIPRQYGRLYPGGPDVLDVNTSFPRDYQEHADAHPAAWSVEDGVIVGRQQPEGSGYGGYLISDPPGPAARQLPGPRNRIPASPIPGRAARQIAQATPVHPHAAHSTP
jgi:hypothetical protein